MCGAACIGLFMPLMNYVRLLIFDRHVLQTAYTYTDRRRGLERHMSLAQFNLIQCFAGLFGQSCYSVEHQYCHAICLRCWVSHGQSLRYK